MEDQNNKTISILGCGWLGLALGEQLVQLGYSVKGSATSTEKHGVMAHFGIVPYYIRLVPELIGDDIDDFLDADVLIVSLPPHIPGDMESFHATQMQYLRSKILETKLRHVIYLSSTSIYALQNRTVTESGTLNEGSPTARALALAESVLRLTSSLNTTMLRLGGLVGYNRITGKYFAGKKDVDNPNSPVNLIHRDDAVGIIVEILRQQKWNILFNAVAPEHPTRKELYEHDAKRIGFEAPVFSQEQGPFKIVSSEKVLKELNYEFKYPDPFGFYYGADPLANV